MRFAGSRTGAEFSPISLASGASGGNYSAAAGAVDLGNTFSAMRDKACLLYTSPSPRDA